MKSPTRTNFLYRTKCVAFIATISLQVAVETTASEPELRLESGILFASNGLGGDSFSNSMDFDGKTAVVGAYERLTPSNRGKGSAYIFDQQADGSWIEVAYLTATETIGLFRYGNSVAISGDTVVVGTKDTSPPFKGFGVVFVYERDKGGANKWGEVTMLEASDASTVDQFGASVAIDGDTIVVGAIGATHVTNTNGAAYVFYRNQGGPNHWGEIAKLEASNAASGDQFGYSVDIDGDTILVGANLGDKSPTGWNEWDIGSAYVFERNRGGADNWGETAYLIAPDFVKDDWFGRTVAVSGNTAIIGANQKADPETHSGAAYVFSRNSTSGTWDFTQRLSGSRGSHDNFGGSVDIDGNYALVAEWLGDGTQPNSGIVHVFQRNAPGSKEKWTAVSKLAPSQTIGGFFGRSVAVSGNTFLAGSELATGAKPVTGAVFVYQDQPLPESPLSITAIARDSTTGMITLEWRPTVSNGTIEQSGNLKDWKTLSSNVTGTSWNGPVPSDPATAYLRVKQSKN